MPKVPVVAIVDDDEAVREALSDLLLVLDLSCRTFDRAEAFMVAAALGYASQTAFAAAFKKLIGETPSDWRRRVR